MVLGQGVGQLGYVSVDQAAKSSGRNLTKYDSPALHLWPYVCQLDPVCKGYPSFTKGYHPAGDQVLKTQESAVEDISHSKHDL